MIFGNTVYTTGDECKAAIAIAERAGVESLWAIDHVLVPARRDGRANGDADRSGGELANVPICDPVAWLAYAAAMSTNIKLATGILIAPQRHPAVVAKEWATLDRLSDGRAILGVGMGWIAEELEAMGVPFGERAARIDESMRAIRSLWTDGPSSFDGHFWSWHDMVSLPKPVQRPGLPIVVGGASPGAVRRAARLGDGFFWPGSVNRRTHTDADDEMLDRLQAILITECRAIERDPTEVDLTVGVGDVRAEVIERLAASDVARVVVAPHRTDRLEEHLEAIVKRASYAEET